MGEACFIGVDLGTSSIKAVLADPRGRVLAREKRATELVRPSPGFVEFSSPRCYGLLCEVVRALLKAAPAGSRVKALALSGAAGDTVLMDKRGEPLCPAVSWMDSRAEQDPACDPPGIRVPDLYRIVGWPWFRGFPLAHLAWLRKNNRATWEKASVYAMNITFLYHRLTGRWGMDHSTATTFFLQDQVKRTWHEPFLDFLGLTEKQLPPLLPSGAALGKLTQQAAAETGLSRDTAVVMGAFDHPSAARGCGVLKPGDVMLSCGTSWVGFYPLPDRELALSQQMLVDPFLAPGGPWGALFSLPKVGEEVQAFVERTFAGSYDRFNEAAEKPGPSRTMMERIAGDAAKRMDELAKAGLAANRVVMVGGPSESPVWPGILQKLIGLKIEIPEAGSYAGALGAALLAGAKRRNS